MMFLLKFISTFVLLLAVDYVWIGLIAKQFYIDNLGVLARTVNGTFSVNLWSGLAVYVVLAVGVCYFALPRISSGIFGSAFLVGALFGLLVYATYDLTNHATLHDYPLKLVIVDSIWGGVLCGLVTQVVSVVFRT